MLQDRTAVLAAIAEEVRGCTACRLYQGTNNPVPGAGNPQADIMFIGEGPGFHEDRLGLPFVGRSGDYLNYLLNLIGLNRDEVFIGNVVKHRPPENRDPSPDEIIACKGFLDRQIEAIDPLVIATLGRFSMARYFPDARISSIHGQPRYDAEAQRAYYPFFHPAAALRNPGLRKDMEADFRRLLDVLAKVKAMRAGDAPEVQAEAKTPPSPPDDKPEEPPQQLKLF
ncbi:MAG: uracil-DNA glycosylase [Anaerolineaceae bacterium]|nr:uracil-DNA glycosylase [Anaerolineaceae bacterium]